MEHAQGSLFRNGDPRQSEDDVRDVIVVVTPSHNAGAYLDQTILSIAQQRGDFEIHYHVQDGGSTDDTLEIVRAWADRLGAADGRFFGGAPMQMSWQSGKDISMYDAIQTGFDFLCGKLANLSQRRVAMTWINADDVFAAGAFHTVAGFLFETSDRHWVTGIPSTISEDGTITDVGDAHCAYSRRDLALGRYDGRRRDFLQQEGTFWTHSLWSTVGGLNRKLRLAGDWDLWRRMAASAGIVTLPAVLAHHRRRPGQLSGELERYWAEVETQELSSQAQVRTEAICDHQDVGLIAKWNASSNSWATQKINLGGSQELFERTKAYDGSVGVRVDLSDQTLPLWVRDASGLSGQEEWGRWSDATIAPSVRIISFRPLPANATLRLRIAVVDSRCSPVRVTVGTRRFDIVVSTEPNDVLLELGPGELAQTIDICPAMSFSPSEEGWGADRRRLGVAIHALEIVATRHGLSDD